MPRSFTFATITEYRAAKGNSGAIYAELVSSGIKSGSCVSKITATGDVFIDSINPFVTPELGQEGDTLYYSSTEGYRFLRAGNSAWDENSYGQVYIDLAKIPSGFSAVAPYTDIFNYKQTDENIGSGKASMTKILGNSVAWNQLVEKYDYTFNSSGIRYQLVGRFNAVRGHKYFVKSSYSGTYEGAFQLYLEGAIEVYSLQGKTRIITCNSTAEAKLYVEDNLTSGSINIKSTVVDLTILYGSSIDGLTDAQILAKFESEFPGYHSYNAGTLLSNKAKAIEFVGFNKWDEEWELGIYSTTTGEKVSSTDTIRCKNYIPVLASTEYYLKGAGLSGIYGVFYYDSNKNFVSSVTQVTNSIITPANACYMTFRCYVDYGTTYNHDICINLSGKRNGQYEPYKKVVLPLPNLDQIKVYSHNIWDEEWENGNISESDGSSISDGTKIRSKNLCPCIAGETYYVKAPSRTDFAWYDSNKNFIIGRTNSRENNTLTIPSGAAYFRLINSSSSYANNICINLSSSFNGQYEPHGILTMAGGLKSAGSVRDEIVGNKYIKRVGSVDLGSLTWFISGNCFVKQAPSEAKSAAGYTVIPNIICPKYKADSTYHLKEGNYDKSICITHETAPYILIQDSAYSDAATFKTAMQNEHVQLYYELATPIEYEIYSPTKMPFNWKYRVSEYHTKKMLPENGENTTSAPFACEIKQI